MSQAHAPHGNSVHRIEALTDGIYAVAMTLLVIDLKVPAHDIIHGADDLSVAVLAQAPKFIAWIISFFVLALFWAGNIRTLSNVRHGTGRLVALTIGHLACVSLMPFSSALIGEYGSKAFAQSIYSADMSLTSVSALLLSRYVHRHAEIASSVQPLGAYRAMQLRVGALIVISCVAIGVNMWRGGWGNVAYMAMAIIMPLSRRLETHLNAAQLPAAENIASED